MSSSSPCITSIGRGANRRAASTGRKRRSSRAHSSNARREARRAHRTDLAGVLEEPPWLRGPVVEVGPRAEQRRAAHPRIVGGHTRRHRAAGVGADQPHPGRRRLADEVVDRRAQVVDPALQREVALARAAAAEVERHRREAELVGHPVDQLGEGAAALAGVERTDREAVAQDHAGQRAVLAGRARQVASELEVVAGDEVAVAVHTRGGSGSRLAMPAAHAPAWPACSHGCAPRPACRDRSTDRSRRR